MSLLRESIRTCHKRDNTWQIFNQAAMTEPCGHRLCDASVTATTAAATPVSKLNQHISRFF